MPGREHARYQKQFLQSSLNAAASPMAKPTDGRLMRPAPIDGGKDYYQVQLDNVKQW